MADKKLDQTPMMKFIKDLYGAGMYDIQDNPIVSSLSTTVTRIIAANPNRVSLKMINASSVTAYVWTDNTVSSTKAVTIPPNSFVTLSLRQDDSLDLISEWWGVSASGSGNNCLIRQIVKVA